MLAGPPSSPAAREIVRLSLMLRRWLIEDACPLWSTAGVDRVHGGFHEAVGTLGGSIDSARRARVAPRQMFAFVQAHRLGWPGDPAPLAEHGLAVLRERYRRPDGLYRTCISLNGARGDERAYLYDQAFVLLGFAEAWKCLENREDILFAAQELRTRLYTELHNSSGGFASGIGVAPGLLANPHMHLLEAALAWWHASGDAAWLELADEVGNLAITHMIDPATGCITENFAMDWSRVGGLIEPGHQFEWAWLLLAWRSHDMEICTIARRLIDQAIAKGVRHGVAINIVEADSSILDGGDRLWPQAEWIKACARASELFSANHYEMPLLGAIQALASYLETPIPGLWHDSRAPDKRQAPLEASAASFYHIVAAIAELNRICGDSKS